MVDARYIYNYMDSDDHTAAVPRVLARLPQYRSVAASLDAYNVPHGGREELLNDIRQDIVTQLPSIWVRWRLIVDHGGYLSWRAYFLGAAIKRARHYLRTERNARARLQRYGERTYRGDSYTEEDSDITREELSSYINGLLLAARLSAQERQVINVMYLNGGNPSRAAAADIVGISRGQLNMVLSRAQQKLLRAAERGYADLCRRFNRGTVTESSGEAA